MKVPIPKSEIRRLEALRNYHILDSAPEREFDDFVKLASHICGVPLATLRSLTRIGNGSKPRLASRNRKLRVKIRFAHRPFCRANLLVC